MQYLYDDSGEEDGFEIFLKDGDDFQQGVAFVAEESMAILICDLLNKHMKDKQNDAR